jgi:hypothetical protein
MKQRLCRNWLLVQQRRSSGSLMDEFFSRSLAVLGNPHEIKRDRLVSPVLRRQIGQKVFPNVIRKLVFVILCQSNQSIDRSAV